MSDSFRPLAIDDAAATLSVLTGYLEGFIEAWEGSDGFPQLRDWLPEEGEIRRFTLAELIKVDLEYRWLKRNQPKRVREYLAEFPELEKDAVPIDVLYEEFHIRRQCGLAVDPREYLEEFPKLADELQRLFGLYEFAARTRLSTPAQAGARDTIEVGQSLDGFDLLARLGKGAFAEVYLAQQQSMQRLVALKISADHGTEPQTLAQLDHDHIVRVFDQRVIPDRGLRLLYMQYFPGGTLQATVQLVRETPPAERSGNLLLRAVDQALEERGESRPAESAHRALHAQAGWAETVCWLGARLALALDYAHRRGVLHRDVKPANVLLTAEGVPKLADFNISFSSKLAGAAPAAYFGGSLAYMSPEQLEACNPAHPRSPESLDGRSDLYSLGVLLWELLTGARPFGNEQISGDWSSTLEQMTARRRQGIDAQALADLPTETAPGLKRVLKKGLAPDPRHRWTTGAELAQQLELCRNPKLQQLLYPQERAGHADGCRFAVWWILLIAAIPNVLAGLFNYLYNRDLIINHLHPHALDVFWRVQTMINAIAYPLGLGSLGALAQSVVREARGVSSVEGANPSGHSGNNGEEERRRHLRSRCLKLGHYAAVIGFCAWAVAGVAYPVSIHLASGTMPASGYIHFFGSLVLCGLIAAAYPFFGITRFSIRRLYPHLWRDSANPMKSRPDFERLNRLAWGYLFSAMAVPMLAVAAMRGAEIIFQTGREEHYALELIFAGLAGLALIYHHFFRPLQADLQVLLDASKGC